jgi:tryptophan-rich sensory protein
VIFLVATVAAAALGSVATSRGMDWYQGLDQPGFTPPDATFGIVWTVLCAAIAVAGWLAWRATAAARPALWWAVRMVLNLAWTIAFFGFESPVAGMVVIALLLAAVAAEIT